MAEVLAPEGIAILRHAHEVGEGKLKLLSETINEPDFAEDPAAIETLKDILKFFNGELRVHFRHEEEALFPALEKVIGRDGPVQVMLDEHQSLWMAIDRLEENVEALEDPQADHKEAAKTIRLVGSHIVGLLSSHIQKENLALFPIAEQSLSPLTLEEVSEQIKAIT